MRDLRPAAALVVLLAFAGCSGGTTVGSDAGVDAPAVVDLGGTDRGVSESGVPLRCGASVGACNLVTSEGCPSGSGCYAGRTADGGVGATCAAAGGGGWGASCDAANGCRVGFACLGTPGVCTKLCCDVDHASCRDTAAGGRAGAVCSGSVAGTDARTCADAADCDLYATSGNRCPAERPRCDLIARDGTAACTMQDPASAPGMEGAGCCTNNRCQPGLVCVPSGTSTGACSAAAPNRVCRRACNPQLTTMQCPSGQSCTVRFNEAPATYGACAPTR